MHDFVHELNTTDHMCCGKDGPLSEPTSLSMRSHDFLPWILHIKTALLTLADGRTPSPGAPGVPIELFRFRRSFQSNSIAKMCPIWSIYIYMSILCFITLSKHKLSVSPTSSALRSKKPSLTSHVSRGLTVQPIIWESIYAMSPPRCRTSKGG